MTSKKIITHCGPTLMGLKTANLFNEHYESKEEIYNEIKAFNKAFVNVGLSMIPLSLKNNHALIYVYRADNLKEDFKNKLAKKLLVQYGYDYNNIYISLRKLIYKMQDYDNFPHEIGLFLGYPPRDVKGFIDNKAENYKALGQWKVYTHVNKALKTFNVYKSCQLDLLEKLDEGYTLKEIVINSE